MRFLGSLCSGPLLLFSLGANPALGQEDVTTLSVSSRDSENLVEWRNPNGPGYGFTRLIARTDRFARDGEDTSGAVVVVDVQGEKGKHESFPHAPVENGVLHFYAAFVSDGRGSFSPGVRAFGKAVDTSGGIHWVFRAEEGATAMSPPGIGIYVFAPSNNGRLYAMERGASGGNTPTKYKPVETLSPIQHRIPVIPVSITSTDHMALASSQDGFVRAIDANSGDLLWTSQPFGMLQASPAASFVDFGAPRDLVLLGTRNADQDNVFAAVNAVDGTAAWTYRDDDGLGIGIVNGGASVDYARGRVYFASHERVGGGSTVFALRIENGERVWRRAIGDVSGSAVQRRGALYVAGDDGRIFALDIDTGDDLAPPFPTANGVPKGFVFPDFASDRLYVSTEGLLWCLEHKGSAIELVWSTDEIPSPSIPTYPPGSRYAWVGGGDGRLYQVEVATGGSGEPPSVTSVALAEGATGIGSPSFDVAQGLVYVGSEDGAVYAVRAPF